MGVSYYMPVTQWSKGEYPTANNTEDDLTIATTAFGLNADDHGNDIGTATAVTVSSLTNISASGVIGTRTDVDYFSFTTEAGAVSISAKPFAYPTKTYANLDILMELYDSDGNLVTSNNADGALDASISQSLSAGTYYIKIDGVGRTGASTDYGYTDYASIGNYSISGTIIDSGAIDSTKPTAAIQSSPSVTTEGATTYSFTIRYSDNTDVKVSSLNTNDIQVTGPNSFNQVATFISATPNNNATQIDAIYTISVPGGSWDYIDNGEYNITLKPNEVQDISNNIAVQATLGTFSVAVHTAPSIVTNPQSLSITAGQSANFSCSGTGEGSLSYQWQKNNSNISGATGTNYSFVSSLSNNGENYRCIVTNGYGSASSTSATLTVVAPTTFSLAGKITLKGTNISGIRVELSTGISTTTDSQGRFSFTTLANGLNYTITPNQVGYSFSPSSISGIITSASVSNANFTTTCATNYIENNDLCTIDLPRSPSSISTTRGTRSDKVVVSWTAVSSATEYFIYRIPATGGTLTRIGRTSSITFNDTQGNAETLYIYSVSSINSVGEGSRTSGSEGWRSDPSKVDSDLDGVKDIDEEIAGTNPNDRGSVQRPMAGEACSEWNGFLQPMFQIKELLNFSSTNTLTNTTLYSIDGIQQSLVTADISAKGKLDLLIHQMSGFTENSYGRVCVRYPQEQLIDGGMTFYKYSTDPDATKEISFAYMAPFLPPITGSQVVSINTYQPSLRIDQSNNPVTNWIQLSNASTTESLSGDLIFFLQGNSQPVCTRRVNLAKSQRFDTPAHSKVLGENGCDALGASKVGYVMWKPATGFETVPATVRNVRYVYDNPSYAPSFTTAFQLEGEVATGEKIFVALDTRGATSVLEVTNVLETSQFIYVRIYDKNGTLMQSIDRTFEPRESQHIIIDSFLNNDIGVASVQGTIAEGVSAVAMEYGRNSDASIKWMYGNVAKQALGSELAGGYNTFLGQDCKILALNTSSTSASIDISLLGPTGGLLTNTSGQIIPGNGIKEFSCSPNQADTYGAVIVSTPSKSIIGKIIRIGEGDSYRFPTPLRNIK